MDAYSGDTKIFDGRDFIAFEQIVRELQKIECIAHLGDLTGALLKD